MKTVKLIFLLFCLTIAKLNFSQTIAFTNSLNCDVKIAYRSTQNTSPNCQNCGAATINLVMNTTTNINFCGALSDLEITILDIGGTTITSGNILRLATACYTGGAISTISGTTPSGCSNFTAGWDASLVWPGPGFTIW